jgi:ribosomal protein L23
VHADANKNDIKHAVLTIYGVIPESVNLLWVKEKGRANRKLVRKSYKKAIVTVPA